MLAYWRRSGLSKLRLPMAPACVQSRHCVTGAKTTSAANAMVPPFLSPEAWSMKSNEVAVSTAGNKVKKLFRVLVLAGVGLAETQACTAGNSKSKSDSDGGSTTSGGGGVRGW